MRSEQHLQSLMGTFTKSHSPIFITRGDDSRLLELPCSVVPYVDSEDSCTHFLNPKFSAVHSPRRQQLSVHDSSGHSGTANSSTISSDKSLPSRSMDGLWYTLAVRRRRVTGVYQRPNAVNELTVVALGPFLHHYWMYKHSLHARCSTNCTFIWGSQRTIRGYKP